MFVNNTELLNKLLQLESKIDQNKHKNDNVHTLIESIEQKLTNIDSSNLNSSTLTSFYSTERRAL